MKRHLMEKTEEISDSMDLMLFLLGISGKTINFERVAEKYGKETASQLKMEIEAAKAIGSIGS